MWLFQLGPNNTRRVLKIWGQALFYSITVFLFGLSIGITNSSIKQILKTIFPITTGAWWFLTTYFVLFLLHPYLNRLLHSLNKRQYQELLLLIGIMWCIIPSFTSLSLCSNELIEFVLFYRTMMSETLLTWRAFLNESWKSVEKNSSMSMRSRLKQKRSERRKHSNEAVHTAAHSGGSLEIIVPPFSPNQKNNERIKSQLAQHRNELRCFFVFTVGLQAGWLWVTLWQ